jgi:thiosulfate/3-mercaptopyruvate sulfurtransferase
MSDRPGDGGKPTDAEAAPDDDPADPEAATGGRSSGVETSDGGPTVDTATDDDGATADGEAPATRRALLRAAAGAGLASTAGCAAVTTPADVAESGAVSGSVGYFENAAWLAERRDEVTVLDARSRARFREERIYGARHVPLDAVTATSETDGGVVPDADALASGFAAAGVTPEDDVVVYGGSVGSRVSRLVFALAYLGHRGDLAVLNGGIGAWQGRVGVGDRTVEPARYDPDPREDLVVTRDWLADRVGSFNDGGPGLVDTRPPEAYLGARGADELVASNDRHGHLPGAVDVHWTGNVSGQYLTDPARLSRLYGAEAGLPRDGQTVVYGQAAVNPTNTWLVLRALGFADVRLYEGGFREWANVPEGVRGRHPVETRTNVVIETEGDLGGGGGASGFSCTG